MIEQYKHTHVELMESSKAALNTGTDPVPLLENRIRVLEESLSRQNRQIRDLQGLVEHLSHKLSHR